MRTICALTLEYKFKLCVATFLHNHNSDRPHSFFAHHNYNPSYPLLVEKGQSNWRVFEFQTFFSVTSWQLHVSPAIMAGFFVDHFPALLRLCGLDGEARETALRRRSEEITPLIALYRIEITIGCSGGCLPSLCKARILCAMVK